MRPDNDATGPHMKLRPNHSDNLYDLQLLRDLQIIGERTQRELGSLPVGGLPVQPKRKPQQPRPAVPPVTQALPPSDEDTTMQWKSVAAVAALATGSTLAACGAESTAAHVDPPAAAVPHAPASVQMPAVEAVTPTAEATVAEPAAPTDKNTPEPARGPVIPVAQLRGQILALLGSFQTLEDLERENVERAFGVRMNIDPEAEDGYTYFANTTEGWLYRIDISHFSPKGSPATVEIFLSNGVDYSDYSTNQQPAYCTLEFELLAKELAAMEYKRDDEIAKFKGDIWWNFEKKIPHANAVFYPMVYLYRVSNAHGESYCVNRIKIGGDVSNG